MAKEIIKGAFRIQKEEGTPKNAKQAIKHIISAYTQIINALSDEDFEKRHDELSDQICQEIFEKVWCDYIKNHGLAAIAAFSPTKHPIVDYYRDGCKDFMQLFMDQLTPHDFITPKKLK